MFYLKLIKRFYLNILLPIFSFLISSSVIFIVIFTISRKINLEDSVVSKLFSIDFGSFFLTFAIVYSGLIVAFFFTQFLIIKFSKKDFFNDIFLVASIKLSYVGALITTMLVSLTAEQFDILISTLSFIGIFSFVIPDKFFSKFINSDKNK